MEQGAQIAGGSGTFANVLNKFHSIRLISGAVCDPKATRVHRTWHSPMRSRLTGVPRFPR